MRALRRRVSREPVATGLLAEEDYEIPTKGERGGAGVTKTDAGHTRKDLFIALSVFLIAFAVRVAGIGHPSGVVFDEVHFGKFASYYIRRQYFFDVHPPLAKLLYGFVGWLVGYDGHYEFENIGESYITNQVPYVALRMLPALLGSAIPAVMWLIMRESGYAATGALLSAALVAFDNAHIVQTRLILLDGTLCFFMIMSFYSYIRFRKLRYQAFTRAWYLWMGLTGLFLSLTLSCKMVGLFGFLTIGTAVAIDLWNILDYRQGHSMDYVMRHFWARVGGLIVLPALVYLFWFWVHFAVLTRSGSGDDFMSSQFQETLEESPLRLEAQDVRFFDIISIQDRQTRTWLHSHPEHYPLRYDDGRISSQGQQVTGYPHNDTNNLWVILPVDTNPYELGDIAGAIQEASDDAVDAVEAASDAEGASDDETDADGMAKPSRQHHPPPRAVKHGDTIQLKHVNTGGILLTHDVASPLTPTNTEFTTWNGDPEFESDTYFEILISGGKIDETKLRTKQSHFQILHKNFRVVLYTHTTEFLPEWASGQQEINGNKNIKEKNSYWFVDSISGNDDGAEPLPAPKPLPRRRMSFFTKFFELQVKMLQHNAGLTDSHPYASSPIEWPFLVTGISFWTSPEEGAQEQIYFIGNLVAWWVPIASVSVILGVMIADLLTDRRNCSPVPKPVRHRLYNSLGFFLMGWAFHYAPFFTMARQLFLHHYLPAHILSSLIAGAVFNIAVLDNVYFPISYPGPLLRARRATAVVETRASVIALFVLTAAIVGMLVYMAPVSYGLPLSSEAIAARRLLSSWTLHFSK